MSYFCERGGDQNVQNIHAVTPLDSRRRVHSPRELSHFAGDCLLPRTNRDFRSLVPAMSEANKRKKRRSNWRLVLHGPLIIEVKKKQKKKITRAPELRRARRDGSTVASDRFPGSRPLMKEIGQRHLLAELKEPPDNLYVVSGY